MSPEQKAKYIASPNVCPYCGSPNITGDSTEIDDGYMSQDVDCSDCKRVWIDIYSLTDVLEKEGCGL